MLPSILDYQDPGAFLKARYRALKESEPGLSHRYISASLGFRSPTIFCQIISGRIRPSARTIDGLARLFRLDGEERDWLAYLFMLSKVDDDRLRTKVLSRFASGSESGSGTASFSNR